MRTAIFLMLLALAVTVPAADEKNGEPENLKIGKPAPTFALPDLKGEQHFLRDFCGVKLRKPWKNKKRYVVVLSFFASWCKPCKKEIPVLHEIHKKYMDRDIKMFLINEQDTKEEVAAIIAEAGYTLPVLLDMYGVAAKNYGLVNEKDNIALPRLFVLDKNGTIRLMNKGFTDSEEEFKNQLSALLDELLAPAENKITPATE